MYYKKFRRLDFSFRVSKKEYTAEVINVTFKYANKEFNQIRKNTYVRFGYNFMDLKFQDCVCLNDAGELIGIQLESPVDSPLPDSILGDYFKTAKLEKNQKKKKKESIEQIGYALSRQPRTLNSRSDLRSTLYKQGFWCDGKHYVRMKRSSGSARVGKCLFINEELYQPLHKWETCGLDIKHGDEIDLAAFESYISLPTSSIIDTIRIKPENILVIDDFESVFTEDVMATFIDGGWLKTEPKTAQITNSVWDGLSLMDESLFGRYKNKGMLLLRNLFFKSCCFNSKIQQWFKDNGITEISQLNGRTLASDIKDIKIITTPSSIKFLKFGDLEAWLNTIDHDFGIVKYDKKTHHFGGRMVQTHYQLINTLQMTYNDVYELLTPTLNFASMLRNDPAAVKLFIKYPEDHEVQTEPMCNRNEVVFNLMNVNRNFKRTKYYKEFVDDLMRSFYKNVKRGHVYVNGNYSTLLGNPIEMLLSAIGQFDGESQIGIGNIHSTRFAYGIELLGSRSPHTSAGNILLVKNQKNELIDKYINLTDEIVCVNSIGENIQQRLNGAD